MGILVLSAGVVLSIVFLALSGLTQGLFQAVLFILGMALLWYVSHSLSHYASAKVYRVNTEYFYVGRSELRKVKSPFSTLFAKYLVTLGTKLDAKKFSVLPHSPRAVIMGSGAIVSTILSLLVLVYAFARGFGALALLLGGVFFIVNLMTEILFSTKAGDLGKMRKELRKKAS